MIEIHQQFASFSHFLNSKSVDSLDFAEQILADLDRADCRKTDSEGEDHGSDYADQDWVFHH